ncbi:MAG: glycoside hydrolase family 57 protein [archaeon]
MKSICFYFQVHQPFRLKRYRIFDIGKDHEYFDDALNRKIMQKVAKKCYLPTNNLMLSLIKKHNGNFKISYSITGTALEQFEAYAPEVLDSFVELSRTGCVEFLSETYYHSLSFLFSKQEFKEQVMLHQQKIKELFGQEPKVFRNTELIYNNELAHHVEKLGYKAILAEGADHILGWRSPNFVYKSKTTDNLKLLLKNYKLSDDIAFRFSNKGWNEWPLSVEKFSSWLDPAEGVTLNLFMDYETFGEHQWEDTGIFNFMKALPGELLRKGIGFRTPTEVSEEPAVAELDIHNPISWADIERDLSAWLGNKMQNSAATEIFAFEKAVKETGDAKLLADWRRLLTSDHLYYMCTKWFSDGDVHKYFNPYDSPYDSYVSFMNIMNDIAVRIRRKAEHLKKEPQVILIHEKPSMTVG